MAGTPTADQIEFIRLGEHTVRVTSWIANEEQHTYSLVTITRGSRDAELLDSLLAQPRIPVKLPDQPEFDVVARDVERRSFGQGQSAITRYGVLFVPLERGDDIPLPNHERSLEERVTDLEAAVAALQALVSHLAKQSRP